MCSICHGSTKVPGLSFTGLLFSCSVVCDSVTLWTAAHEASLSFTIPWSLFKLMSSESVMPSNHLILFCPLLLLPSVFLSIRVFSNESALGIKWPKYWRCILVSIIGSSQATHCGQEKCFDWPGLGGEEMVSQSNIRVLVPERERRMLGGWAKKADACF